MPIYSLISLEYLDMHLRIPLRYGLAVLMLAFVSIGFGYLLDSRNAIVYTAYTLPAIAWCSMVLVAAIGLLTRRAIARWVLRAVVGLSYVYLLFYIFTEITPETSSPIDLTAIYAGLFTLLTMVHWFLWRISYHPWLFEAPSAHDTTGDDILDY